jgi:antitoxin component YwqK of YwqJK toxin-antitoxin module
MVFKGRDMKYLFGLSISVITYFQCYAQNEVLNAMIELDKRMTNYEILKKDTLFFQTGEIEKIRYYDSTSKIRKSITYYKTGNLKEVFNVNSNHQLDGLLLEMYENGIIENFGVYVDNTGFSYRYYENGRIKKYSQSKDSYLINYEVSFCSEGELYSEIFYDSTGYSVTGYHCNGNLRARGRNESAYIQQDGKWEYWNEKGILIKEEFWEKGILKETKEYDDEGNLKK